MKIWVLIGTLTVITVALKTVGPVVAGGRQLSPALRRVVVLLGPALMASLIVSNTFTNSREVVIDARAGGLVIGLIALLCRLPVILAAVLAAATCVAIRTLTG